MMNALVFFKLAYFFLLLLIFFCLNRKTNDGRINKNCIHRVPQHSIHLQPLTFFFAFVSWMKYTLLMEMKHKYSDKSNSISGKLILTLESFSIESQKKNNCWKNIFEIFKTNCSDVNGTNDSCELKMLFDLYDKVDSVGGKNENQSLMFLPFLHWNETIWFLVARPTIVVISNTLKELLQLVEPSSV